MTKPSKVYEEEVNSWLKHPVTLAAFQAMQDCARQDQKELITTLMQSELDDRSIANETLETKTYVTTLLELSDPSYWVGLLSESDLIAKEDDTDD